MQQDIKTSDEYLCDIIKSRGERRRTRIKGYYCCFNCDNNIITGRNYSNIRCPICNSPLALVSTITQTTVDYIKGWGMPLEEKKQGYNLLDLYMFKYHFIKRTDIPKRKKDDAIKSIMIIQRMIASGKQYFSRKE